MPPPDLTIRPSSTSPVRALNHFVLELALEALPPSALDGEILARAGACRETKVRFSLGYTIRETVREAMSLQVWSVMKH